MRELEITCINEVHAMHKDLSTTGYYQSIKDNGSEFVLRYEKKQEIAADKETDSVSYGREVWETRVGYNDMQEDHLVYTDMKKFIELGQVRELIKIALFSDNIRRYLSLMSWESLELMSYDIEQYVLELDANKGVDVPEEVIVLYALVTRYKNRYSFNRVKKDG
jgi:hypothetical protein